MKGVVAREDHVADVFAVVEVGEGLDPALVDERTNGDCVPNYACRVNHSCPREPAFRRFCD